MPAPTPELTIRPVETTEDAEAMRVLRNHCRRWMTRDQRPISPERQQKWWASRPITLKAFLYCVEEQPIGFGLLREANGKWWATLGLLRKWRGKGLGTRIYRHLIAQSSETLWIEVRANNTASLTAAQKAGFMLVEERPEGKLLKVGEERG